MTRCKQRSIDQETIVSQPFVLKRPKHNAMIEVLNEAETRYLDIAPLFIVLIDAEQRIAFINKKGAALLGYDRAELLGKNWFDAALPDEVRNEVKHVFSNVVSTDVSPVSYYENPVKDKHNGLHYLAWNNAFIRNNDGQFLHAFSFGIDITEKKVLENHVAKLERERRRQVAETELQTQHRERRFIATELHDNVNQLLTTCKLLLEHECSKGNGLTGVERSVRYLQQAIDTIRALSHKISPPVLHGKGLRSWLHQIAEDLNAASRISIEVVCHDENNCEQVDSAMEFILFRLVQEQLTNVIKHARAHSVRLSMSMSQSCIEIEIQDDGQGFVYETCKKGLGITSMQERIRLINGRLYFDTSPGEGCTLSIYVPLG